MIAGEMICGETIAGETSAGTMTGAGRLCAFDACAVTQTDDEKHKRAASVRATLPMNDPGGRKMTLSTCLDSACDHKVLPGEVGFLRPAKYPNRRVLASILTGVFEDIPMISGVFGGLNRPSRKRVILLAFVLSWMVAATFPARAQQPTPPPPANPNQQEAPPEAGGPKTMSARMSSPRRRMSRPRWLPKNQKRSRT